MTHDEHNSSGIADPRGPEAFDTTHWSLVVAAGHRSSPQAEAALEALCRDYWYPLYAYVRRRVPDVHAAQDLTQAFFATLLEKNYVAEADQQRGRFRAFLVTAIKHFLGHERDKARAQKRGGGRPLLSLDFADGESRYALEPADDETPERTFHRRWAATLLQRVLAQLRDEMQRAGRERQFEALKEFLSAAPSDAAYDRAAAELGITVNAAYVAAHRLRRRYRQLLRAEIAQTVADPAEVDDEIAALFAALATGRE